MALPSSAPEAERVMVWSDTTTGFAIGGYDPLSYFIERGPMKGDFCCEGEWAGTFWKFANEGNRAAFLDAPSVYVPRFGGHDPVSVSRGYLVPGDPEIWVIDDGDLYLFQSYASRTIWRISQGSMKRDARAYWTSLR